MAESKEEVPTTEEAERLKRVGNEAFVAKKYDEAISHYTKAISIDPENAVLYSNRSACYAAKQRWDIALEDAVLCVSKDPKFIKGYFRLSAAQMELKQYSDAEATLKAVLQLEPDNDLVPKHLAKVQKAKKAAAAAAKKPTRQLDEAQQKEFMELQEQINAFSRDLRGVQAKLSGYERDTKINAVTANEVEKLDPSTPMYLAVGKTFLFTERSEIESKLEKEIENITKNKRDLLDRQEYLERKIKSDQNNLKDLTAGL